MNTGSHSRAYGNWRKKGLPAMATGADGSLVIHSTAKPRAGWAAAFAEMAQHGGDALPDDPVPTRWDEDEWEWR